MSAKMFPCLLAVLLCCQVLGLRGQSADLSLNTDLYHYIDRIDIMGLADTAIHTDLKPYDRRYLSQVFARVGTPDRGPQELGWHERMRVLIDDDYAGEQAPKGLWNLLYRNSRNLLSVDKNPNFRLYADPILNVGGGMERVDGKDLNLFSNTRGLVLRGSMLDLIGFYTEVSDNVTQVEQFIFDKYAENGVLPGQEFVKRSGKTRGLDYFSSRAYVTVSPIKDHLRIKFGKDRSLWGNGYQSVLLNDQSADYLQLLLQIKVWKLAYTSHFTEMIDFIPNKNDQSGSHPRKYSVFHQLTFYPTKDFSFSFFESVVYSPWLANGYRGFELQYLNPIIFYRSVEQSIGSPDNALLGLQAKWNLFKTLQLYGQFNLDDFNVDKYQEGKGYWGNKYGWQIGAKYLNAFTVPTLDLQFEVNEVRPYTYQHFSSSANYSNYYQPLGHSMGANLRDFNFILRYHPFAAWNLYLSYTYLFQGRDDDSGLNYGGDISRPYVDRPREFGNTIGQGVAYRLHHVFGRISYQIGKANAFLDLEGRYRNEDGRNSYSIRAALRVSIAPAVIKY